VIGKTIHPHMLRHAGKFKLANQGVDARTIHEHPECNGVVSQILGCRSLRFSANGQYDNSDAPTLRRW
jgi:hypothetical protein